VVRAEFAKLLRHTRTERGMQLIEERSRAVRRGELHEIVVTDAEPLPGDRIDRVGFLGFAEVLVAGVIEAGDEVTLAGADLGVVIGFDACHFPNHYNVLIRADRLVSATELDLRVGDQIEVAEGQPPSRST
jgi:hypothetical protein